MDAEARGGAPSPRGRSAPMGPAYSTCRAARHRPGALHSRPVSETATIQQWICTSCGFIYDPEQGDPDGGIPAGTAFDDIPDDWFCPVCGARKKDFELHEG
jgi:rubredoxin